MRGRNVPLPAVAGADAPSKTQDEKDFLARWIPYGKSLKNRAEAYGIDWRGLSFEQYIAAIGAAEKWAMPEGADENA